MPTTSAGAVAVAPSLSESERTEITDLLADINLDVSRAFRRYLQLCTAADYPLLAALFKLSHETNVALRVVTGELHDQGDPIIIN